jgi:uncharacterized delta-60 repeat protein
VTVEYRTSDLTALAGGDYAEQTGVLAFAPGETLKGIKVPLLDDSILEEDEAFQVIFTNPDGGARWSGASSALVRLRDNESPSLLAAGFHPGAGLDDRVRALAVQRDGNVLVAGDFNFADGVRRDEVARFYPDGTLDPTFDAGPALRGRLGLGGMAVAAQADGKVLVGGDFRNTNETRGPILVRLQPDGAIDPSFLPATTFNNRIRAIVPLPNGKVLVGGSFSSADGRIRNVARLNPDGSLDPAFVLSNDAPAGGLGDGEVRGLAVQPDGKILLAGYFTRFGTITRRGVARLEADGALDTTFDPGLGASADTASVAVQPDGKILLAGDFLVFNGQQLSRIARLNPDGSVDLTFRPTPGPNRETHAVGLQADGKVLLGGEFTEVNGLRRERIARLHPDGSLDLSFNPGQGLNDEVRALVVGTQGAYIGGDFTVIDGLGVHRFACLDTGTTPTPALTLVLGQYAVPENSTTASLTVRRLAASDSALAVHYRTVPGTATANEYVAQSGTLTFSPMETSKTIAIPLLDDNVAEDETTFTVELTSPGGGAVLGAHPRATVTILDSEVPLALDPSFRPPLLSGEVNALALQPDGKLLVGGVLYHATGMASLVRLNVDGSMDPGFVARSWGAYVRALLVLPDHRIVVGGILAPVTLARLHSNGQDDPTFAPPSFDDQVRVIMRTSDHKLMVGGEFTRAGAVERKRIARLTENGALDPSFDPGNGANDQVLAIQEQTDGKFIIAGRFTKFAGASRSYIARLLPGGAPDPTFIAMPNDRVRTVALLPGGRMLVGGRFTAVAGAPRLYLARLNSDGSLDLGFVPAAVDEEIRSLAVMPDGRIVIAGEFATVAGLARSRIARLHADGSLDHSFIPGPVTKGTIWSVLVQADGKIVSGGEPSWTANLPDPILARFSEETLILLALRIGPAGGDQLRLSWSGAPGLRLQRASTLSNPVWTDVPGSEGLSSFDVLQSRAVEFFRVIKP